MSAQGPGFEDLIKKIETAKDDLDLSKHNIGDLSIDDMLIFLETLKKNDEINLLNLENNNIITSTAALIVYYLPKNLKKLIIKNNLIGNVEPSFEQHFFQTLALTNLIEIDLSNNHLAADSILLFVKNIIKSKLTSVDLYDNPIYFNNNPDVIPKLVEHISHSNLIGMNFSPHITDLEITRPIEQALVENQLRQFQNLNLEEKVNDAINTSVVKTGPYSIISLFSSQAPAKAITPLATKKKRLQTFDEIMAKLARNNGELGLDLSANYLGLGLGGIGFNVKPQLRLLIKEINKKGIVNLNLSKNAFTMDDLLFILYELAGTSIARLTMFDNPISLRAFKAEIEVLKTLISKTQLRRLNLDPALMKSPEYAQLEACFHPRVKKHASAEYPLRMIL